MGQVYHLEPNSAPGRVTFFSVKVIDSAGDTHVTTSRLSVEMAKYLRTRGFEVDWDGPEPDAFFHRRGILDLFSNPVVLLVAQIPIGIFVNMITPWLNSIGRRTDPQAPRHRIGIRSATPGNDPEVVLEDGKLTSASVESLRSDLRWQAERHRQARLLQSPSKDHPFPVFLEHGDSVVGWAALEADELGLQVTSGILTDDDVRERIAAGELKGLSIGGIVRDARCSFCRTRYVSCDHTSGLTYDGTMCVTEIHDVDLCEVSIVADPVCPEALVRLTEDL